MKAAAELRILSLYEGWTEAVLAVGTAAWKSGGGFAGGTTGSTRSLPPATVRGRTTEKIGRSGPTPSRTFVIEAAPGGIGKPVT